MGLKRYIALLSASALTLSGLTLSAEDWKANLMGLDIIIHVDSRTGTVTMDSPNQGAFGLKCDVDMLDADSISFSIPNIMLKYTGKRSGNNITGTFSQNGMSLPLSFELQNNIQRDTIPEGITEENVVFNNGDISLAGTLTQPKEECKGVILLLNGSGLQDRDEYIFGHRPFRTMAHYLASAGWASLRYDDRGVGGSSAGKKTDTTFDYASDALSAQKYLKGIKEFQNKKIGIIGHSEGALIAMINASGYPELTDFIISINGPGLPGKDILISQHKLMSLASGMDEQEADNVAATAASIYECYSSDSEKEIREKLLPIIKDNKNIDPEKQLDILLMPWMVTFIKTDPATYLKNIKCPILVLAGEYDAQVEPTANSSAIKNAAPQAEVKIIDRANHLMQQSPAFLGSTDYAGIKEDISEVALKAITDWLATL